MKIMSKMLTTIMVSAGAAFTLMGTIMFSVGGAAPYYKTIDNPGVPVTTQSVLVHSSIGWFNYDGAKFALALETTPKLNSLLPSIVGWNNLSKYEDFLKFVQDNSRVIHFNIEQLEDRDDDNLEILKDSLKNPLLTEAERNNIIARMTQLEQDISIMSTLLAANSMYNVAIAGIVFLPIGIIVSAIGLVMAMNITKKII